ncbi:HU family DNA-binding protein [Actinomadura sp. NPDC049382]|uniref:HU family DNA-binding protein n=1 Tax=Actinomadura sp. NPDC049382 TaxID=3158220 RepID=UPI003445CBAD
MNRSELVKMVAERAGSDEAAARRHVDAVFDTVMERVSAGERVTVTGFGTFDSFARPARSARNPRTGLPVEVPAAQVPRFRSGQTFRTRVAGDAPAAVPAAETEAAVAVAAPVEAPAPKPSKNGKKPKKNAEAKAEGKEAKKDAGAKKRPAEAAPKKAAPKKAEAKNDKADKNAKNGKGGKSAKKKAGKGKARAKAAS